LPLLTTVLVDRIFIRFFFWQGGHADEPVMGFLVSIHTLFFSPVDCDSRVRDGSSSPMVAGS
jgi:hypothetical protein